MSAKIEHALEILLDPDAPLTAKAIYNLSDLSGEDKDRLYREWGTIPLERRRKLMSRITEISETNFEMDFSTLTRLALTDLDAELREIAIESAWSDESPEMLRQLMPMASIDMSIAVRAAAVGALGRFIELGEHAKFDKQLARQAENLAIRIYKDEKIDTEIRRRALEAISHCSRSEVPDMIEDAYNSRDIRMRASAVFAMGQSADERWEEIVLKEMRNRDALMRFEAARASGELAIEAAVPILTKMLDEDDREVMEMAIWSLGEIGGAEAQRLLHELSDRIESEGDDDLIEAIEEALASASLSGGDMVF
ncbi:MAG: HEAT repeat domain-containing protein [Anaerolineae bacterium]|nr:HEAT repeat domain-containing protein [Anaerolineae bacterium]